MIEALRRTRHRAALAAKRARRPMRPTPARLKIKAWNVHVGADPAKRVQALAHELRVDQGTDVVGLNEAGGLYRTLKGVFGDDWRIWRGSGAKDGVVMMVCRDLRVPRHHVIAHAIPWIGPKAFRRHVGRAFPWADIGRGRDEHKHRVVVDHRTPGGPTGGVKTRGRNRPAWQKEDELLERFANRKSSKRRAFAIVGDKNCKAGDRHPLSIWSLAKRIGGELLATNTAVDHAIIRDYDGVARRGEKMGSDHFLVTYSLKDARK